jgi:hypothetical protein
MTNEDRNMNATDYLGLYAEGWTNGDADTILSAVSNDYIFDDPNAGKITKASSLNIWTE